MYRNYKPHYLPSQGFFNHVAFNINISFLLASSFYLIFYTMFKFFDMYKEIFTINTLYVFLIISYIIIGCKTVLVSAYFNDVFFCFIILICQIGILVENYKQKNKDHIISVIFIIFSCVCFVFSLLFTRETHDDKDDDKVIENYVNDNTSRNY